MPLPYAPFVAALLGLALAYYGRAELALAERSITGTRTFLVAMCFTAFVFAPALGYFAAFHGDWAYLYLAPAAKIPSAIDLALVLASSSVLPLTLAYAAPLVGERRAPRLLRIAAVLGLVLLVLFTLTFRRVSLSASHAQFKGSFGAVPIGQSPLGRGVLLAWLAIGASIAWARSSLKRLI